jgi:hypothetical protein
MAQALALRDGLQAAKVHLANEVSVLYQIRRKFYLHSNSLGYCPGSRWFLR